MKYVMSVKQSTWLPMQSLTLRGPMAKVDKLICTIWPDDQRQTIPTSQTGWLKRKPNNQRYSREHSKRGPSHPKAASQGRTLS